MKRLFALLLCLALALTLAACGEASGSTIPLEPPALTVTNAAGNTVTARSWSYDWNYSTGYDEWMGTIADSAHPLDESCRDLMPILEMPVAVSILDAYAVTLDFGGLSPQSVSIRHWGEECWGDFEAKNETIIAEETEGGAYTAAFIPSVGIFAVDVVWDAEQYNGRATYCFRTAAENVLTLNELSEYRFDAAQVKKLDLSWLSGGVSVQTGAQTEMIVVKETAGEALGDDARMTCTLVGDTLSVRFLSAGNTGSLSAQKYLTVYVPEGCALDEVEVETSSAYVSVDSLNAREVEISTVSGGVGLFGSYEEAEIETTSGDAVLAGTFGTVDFESVSGALEVTADAALTLEAETTSGAVTVALPEGSGVTLRFATTSGTLDTLLTQRAGTMVVCGNGFEGYSIPGAPGAESGSIEVKTVSGDLTVTERTAE